MGSTACASGVGKLAAPKLKTLNEANPGPLYPSEPSCWPVSENTPPPPRSTVSYPGLLRSTNATPRRGAKLYQVVFHSGVPCGASVSVARLEPCTVYGRLPEGAP